jgi:hypothetical protein
MAPLQQLTGGKDNSLNPTQAENGQTLKEKRLRTIVRSLSQG